MKVGLRGSYIEFVFYMGFGANYPMWFAEELYHRSYIDENKYTLWVPKNERRVDYYEKKEIVEEYSIFIRKSNGEIHVTTFDAFMDLYTIFRQDALTNSGIAALNEDSIEYVECRGKVQPAGYPPWFYEYWTEAVHLTPENKYILFSNNDEVSVMSHCVFLRNKYGEIRTMQYPDFLRYYDPKPMLGVEV